MPRSVVKMIDAPEETAPLIRDFACILHDLGAIEPLQLSRAPEVLAGLLALRVIHVERIPADLLERIVGGPVAGSAFEQHIIRYVVEGMNLAPAQLEAALRRTKPDRWETLMGTVAEAWLEQGRAEGRAEGRTEGRAEGRAEGQVRLLRQLEFRFGQVPEAARDRIRAASTSELDAWAELVFGAASLEDVLAAGSRAERRNDDP